MAYNTQADLENAIGAARVLALYDDSNSGTVNATALSSVLARGTTHVDSYLSKQWDGPFPMPSPVPPIAAEGALLICIALSYLRSEEYVQQYGDGKKVELYKQAEKLCDELVKNQRRLVATDGSTPDPAGVTCRVDFGPDDAHAGGFGGGFLAGGFGDY